MLPCSFKRPGKLWILPAMQFTNLQDQTSVWFSTVSPLTRDEILVNQSQKLPRFFTLSCKFKILNYYFLSISLPVQIERASLPSGYHPYLGWFYIPTCMAPSCLCILSCNCWYSLSLSKVTPYLNSKLCLLFMGLEPNTAAICTTIGPSRRPQCKSISLRNGMGYQFSIL